MNTELKYQPKDFKSSLEVKWCPGCGDHAILAAVQKALPEVAAEHGYGHERFVFVSGIGCSSRFPYYMNTYGFHSIHGRAAAIASGVKVANPELSVWEVTGDGDALAIGGNHFIHAVRRNVDLNILLFNNQIYGLTKGQYSPTSKKGKITKTSPFGTIEQPFNPGELVIGARGTFFARSIDAEMNLSQECMIAAARHQGTSVLEILQNCVIFNDRTFGEFADKEVRADRTIVLEDGKPMVFGQNRDKGLMQVGNRLEVVKIGENGITEKDLLVHNAGEPNPIVHMMLANMQYPDYPVALGVIRNVADATYDGSVREQIAEVQKTAKISSMDDLLNAGDVWDVTA